MVGLCLCLGLCSSQLLNYRSLSTTVPSPLPFPLVQAVDTEDLNDISARLDRMVEMGLDDEERFPQFKATIDSAKEMRAKLKTLIDAKNALKTAIADRNIGSLKAAIQQAAAAGLPATESGPAQALVAAIEAEEAALTALRSALNDHADDAAALAAALVAAQHLNLEGDLIDNAEARVKRLSEQAAAGSALTAAIAKNDARYVFVVGVVGGHCWGWHCWHCWHC